MTMIETSPRQVATLSSEKQKRIDTYSRRDVPQEHGSASQQKGHAWERSKRVYQRDFGIHTNAKKDKVDLTDSLTDKDYSSMSTRQLELAADNFLRENGEDVQTYSTFTPDMSRSESEYYPFRGEESSGLAEEYKSLVVERLNYLDFLASPDKDDLSEEQIAEIQERIGYIEYRAEAIEEIVLGIMDEEERFLTEAEFGLDSKKDIKSKLGRKATLDHSYETEDDYGDPTYASGHNITYNPR